MSKFIFTSYRAVRARFSRRRAGHDRFAPGAGVDASQRQPDAFRSAEASYAAAFAIRGCSTHPWWLDRIDRRHMVQ